MPRCERYEEALIDHALGAPADPALEAHLAACTACRARLDEERRLASTVDGILKSTLDVAPALGFDLAVRRRVAGTRRSWHRRPLTWIGGGLLAAAAALILSLLMRSAPPPPAHHVVKHNAPPVPTSAPEATTAPVVAEEDAAPAATQPHRAMRRRPSVPAEREVLVDPEENATLLRFAERVRRYGVPSAVIVPLEPPIPFQPPSLEVGTPEDLPRLPVTVDVRQIEPATPLHRLASGGDI